MTHLPRIADRLGAGAGERLAAAPSAATTTVPTASQASPSPATSASAPSASPGPESAPELSAGPSRAGIPERTAVSAALDRVAHPATVRPMLAAAGVLAWLGLALVCALAPDSSYLPQRDRLYIARANPFTVGAALVVAAAWAGAWALSYGRGRWAERIRRRVVRASAWMLGSALYLLLWVVTTAKTALFAPPYLVAPQEILERIWDSRVMLSQSLANSLLLLATGFFVGLIAGLATGVTIGWFRTANYWVHPVLVFIGPVPSLAWVPIVFVLFPTAYSGAVFMIALSVWFPITVLTRAGILSVPRSYVDVAQTLGASTWFLVWRVSLPAALPSIFTGAFMALGSSFVALTVAENFGVNAGLGWYLNWKKGWGDFPGLYGGIVVLIAVCGLALTLLFRIRNHVLRWQKELTRW